MIIALDYDGTFIRDPEAWTTAMTALKLAGHLILGVTMRYPAEKVGMDTRYDDLCHHIHFTSRRGKKNYLTQRGIAVDVWIDDNPIFILQGATQ